MNVDGWKRCPGVRGGAASIIEELDADQWQKRIQDLLFQLNEPGISYWPSR